MDRACAHSRFQAGAVVRGRPGAATPALWLLAVIAGCADNQDQIRRALLETRPPPAAAATAEMAYRVACPDVLEVRVAGRPELSGLRPVEPNGCIDMGKLGGIRAEGLTAEEVQVRIREALAANRVVPVLGADGGGAEVRVTLAEHKSQQVYLFGHVNGLQRAVPYRGPEPVVELLRRAGGLSPEGTVRHVQVVRSANDGRNAQTFDIDLAAILLDGDSRTNILIEPYDQVYVGQSRQAAFNKCVHPLLRPLSYFVRDEKPKRPPNEKGGNR